MLLLILLSFLAWAILIEPDRLVVNEQQIHYQNWPREFDHLRIAIISDVHAGSPHIDEKKLSQIVAKTDKEQPDLILLLGDYGFQQVRGGRLIEPEVIAEKFKDFRAPLGVYAVLGNHDWWYDGQRVTRALTGVGIRVLENEAVSFERNGHRIWIVGLADLWTRRQNISGSLGGIPEGEAVIAFTHNPDVFPQIPSNVFLTLAGHTHGGQVCFPLVGCPITPSRYGARFTRGLVQENGRFLFVTSGIGTSIYPVRFRVPPEIALLTISDI